MNYSLMGNYLFEIYNKNNSLTSPNAVFVSLLLTLTIAFVYLG